MFKLNNSIKMVNGEYVNEDGKRVFASKQEIEKGLQDIKKGYVTWFGLDDKEGHDFTNMLDLLEFEGIKFKNVKDSNGLYSASYLDTRDNSYNVELSLINEQLVINIGGLLSVSVHANYEGLMKVLTDIEHTDSIDSWLIQNNIISMMQLGVKKFFNANPEYNNMFGTKEELEDNMKGIE